MDTNITGDVSPQNLSLCSVVKAELLYGAAKFDDSAAAAYSTIRAELEKRGAPIGPNDLMIAAIALANGLILVTHNQREFGRVATLKLEDWE